MGGSRVPVFNSASVNMDTAVWLEMPTLFVTCSKVHSAFMCMQTLGGWFGFSSHIHVEYSHSSQMPRRGR
jgi:hypothetical protein